jgi:hypothetical protein
MFQNQPVNIFPTEIDPELAAIWMLWDDLTWQQRKMIVLQVRWHVFARRVKNSRPLLLLRGAAARIQSFLL